MSRTFRQMAESMTVSELASALGVSRSAASMIRTGRRNVTIARLHAFGMYARRQGLPLDMALSVSEEAVRIGRARELRGGESGNG